MSHHLLPKPKRHSLADGTFSLDAETLIFIQSRAGDDLFYYACQLQEEIQQSVGVTLAIIKAFAPTRSDNIILLACGQDQATGFGLAPAKVEAPPDVADQAYALSISPGRIFLYANEPAGLFYAIQTLRQLVRLEGAKLPGLAIQDWPTLRYRGLMLDISRGKVPTLETLEHLISELSHYKLNVFQLYIEHTFQFPRHPKIGAGCGSLSSADILRLDAFCRIHNVELMPNLQSFGHARNTLTIPDYSDLAETDALWTLSPAYEETYALLDELFGDMLPAFSSNNFNIGCDETYDLGQGASQAMAEEIGLGRVYLDHIQKVRQIAARHGRQIQAWGDILLHHPELIGEVPDDVTLLDWNYAPSAAYPTPKIFAGAKRRFWVCPGVGSWNSIFPRIYGANINIRNFVRDGVDAGAEGMLNTEWGDAGHYQYMGLSWHGYLVGAAQGWTGGVTGDDEFNAAFGPLFFGPDYPAIMEALHQLARTNELPNVYRPNRSHTVLALFDEPLTGETVVGQAALPADTLEAMESLAHAAASACDRLANGHPRELTLREMASAARLTSYAARKTALAQIIRRCLQEIAANPEPLSDNAVRLYAYIRSLKALEIELEDLRAEFESLWLNRARRSEIHRPLAYFASLRMRFRAAIGWLIEQHDALLRGSPIDAELETYHVSNHRVLWHTWQDKSAW